MTRIMGATGPRIMDEPDEPTSSQDRAEQIEDDFLAILRQTEKGKKLQENIKPNSSETSSSPNSPTEASASTTNLNAEKTLANLSEIHEDLIESFERAGINSVVSESLNSNINKIASCIRELGGEAADFSPLQHASGLAMPDSNKNAARAIENTKQCYSLGKISKSAMGDDGKTIAIAFAGVSGDMEYEANGTISPLNGWSGNEAIDYVYTRGEGRMSVKALDGNRWIDKSEDYDISWELEEKEIGAIEPEPKPVRAKVKTKAQIKTAQTEVPTEVPTEVSTEVSTEAQIDVVVVEEPDPQKECVENDVAKEEIQEKIANNNDEENGEEFPIVEIS